MMVKQKKSDFEYNSKDCFNIEFLIKDLILKETLVVFNFSFIYYLIHKNK